MTTELVTVEQASPLTLFGTDNPDAIIASATAKANALARVIRDKKLFSNINGRDYVRVEGWTLLGTMLGVFPVCEWTRLIEGGWEARVEARTLDGRIVGAAEAQCTHLEGNWKNRDEFALRSMAQTRATSKALRLPLGFVMALAGYETTPAEEMAAEFTNNRPAPQNNGHETEGEGSPPDVGDLATEKQASALYAQGRKLGWSAEQTRTKVESFCGVAWDDLTSGRASAAIKHFDLLLAKK